MVGEMRVVHLGTWVETSREGTLRDGEVVTTYCLSVGLCGAL
jgi:hypothetical protein